MKLSPLEPGAPATPAKARVQLGPRGIPAATGRGTRAAWATRAFSSAAAGLLLAGCGSSPTQPQATPASDRDAPNGSGTFRRR